MSDTTEALQFLRESNNIEDVWDDDSLIQAFYAWEYLLDQIALTPHVLLKTHKILMLHQPLLPNQIGYFRTQDVFIGGRKAPDSFLIDPLIEKWCKDAMTSIEIPGENASHIKLDHIEYERIHPFVDGNGRTGRLFMNWQRVRAGYSPLTILEQDKQEYYDWFK